MQISTIKQIKSVISKFPHIKDRVPYTYHHDWIREYVPDYYGCSREEIAALKSDEYELYALALMEIIRGVSHYDLVLLELSNEDRNIIRECMAFADELK